MTPEQPSYYWTANSLDLINKCDPKEIASVEPAPPDPICRNCGKEHRGTFQCGALKR